MRTWRQLPIVLGLVGAVVAIGVTAPLGSDYPGPPCPTCDYAGPPIEALVHGHLRALLDTQPVMGSFSLLVRAPFAAIATIGHHGALWEYRLGSLACLIAAALLAWWLVRIMELRGRTSFAQIVVAAMIVAGPLTFMSLRWGHPEELLAGALSVGAVLMAGRGRSVGAGVLLGLALATKPWAWLVVIPVLMIATERRRALALAAASAAAALTLPMMLGNPGRFFHMLHVYGVGGLGVTPSDIWWAFGHQAGIEVTPHGAVGSYAVPAWIGTVAHPLVVVLGILLPGVFWLAHRGGGGRVDLSDVLHLVALIFLLRCLLDASTYSYYHAPFMFALVAGEAVGRRRLPYVAMVSTVVLWSITEVVARAHDADLLNRVYLAWAVPVVVYLLVKLFAAETLPRWFGRLAPGGGEIAAAS